MQEYGWLNWNDFARMAELVCARGDQRRIRLAACAVVSQLADRITDSRTAAALDAAEAYADHGVRRQDLRLAAAAAGDVVRELEESLLLDKPSAAEEWSPHWHPEFDDSAESLGLRLRYRGRELPEARVARLVAQLADPRSFDAGDVIGLSLGVAQTLDPGADTRAAQVPHCASLRDIFGNPFRPVVIDQAWRTQAVVSLARGMYEARDFAAMPVLADALEDAGCGHPDILAHCRGPGPHVRGCWVVDLVLGKG